MRPRQRSQLPCTAAALQPQQQLPDPGSSRHGVPELFQPTNPPNPCLSYHSAHHLSATWHTCYKHHQSPHTSIPAQEQLLPPSQQQFTPTLTPTLTPHPPQRNRRHLDHSTRCLLHTIPEDNPQFNPPAATTPMARGVTTLMDHGLRHRARYIPPPARHISRPRRHQKRAPPRPLPTSGSRFMTPVTM